MFDLSIAWWELIARGVIVYIALLVMVRLSGKRTIGEFSPFDVIVLLLIAEASNGSLIGGDESVQGGLVVIATLIALNVLVAFVSTRSRRIDRVLQGTPVTLVRNGRVDGDALLRNNVPRGDLDQALRSNEITRVEDVELAILEPDGEISIFKKHSRD